ncbi:MAG TPA: alpha-hydroxy acid oxidase [Bryobacteraceae bacterium]|nr:alpha-hydroxy acid oxidase [Bryobacteraceae bacterium]
MSDILATPLVTLADYDPCARERLPHMVYEYIAGGAGDEITLRANREAFDRIRLRPRILVDVSSIDTSTTLFGQHMASPILLAPCAYLKLIHSDGEREAVRGANLSQVTLLASTSASTSFEDMAAVATQPIWFQLYTSTDKAFTRDLLARVEAAGSRVLCITVDAPARGLRDRDSRCSFTLPKGIERPNFRGLNPDALSANARAEGRSIYSPNLDPRVTWDTIAWIKSIVKMPIILKGLLTAEDSRLAVQAGMDGIVVSNHGGRTLDTFPGSMEVLPEIVEAVDGSIPVLVDGGVRRGTDVLKAIAMGAAAVLIGRPYLYGLALDGAEGVRKVVDTLRRETEMALAMCGRRSLAEVDQSLLWR